MAFNDCGVGQCAREDQPQSSSPSAWNETSQPKSRACHDGEVEAGHHEQVVNTAGLKLSFNGCGETELSSDDHSKHKGLDIRLVREWSFQPGFYPILDSIRSVPSSVEDRNQTGISYGAGPVDSLSFEIAAVIKYTRITIDDRAMQLDHDLQTVARAELQRIEQGALLRTVEKLRQARAPAKRLCVDGRQLKIEI